MALSSSERRMRASLAAHTKWSQVVDRTSHTQPGRDAFLKRFYDEVDPDRKLPADTREKLATSAKKAYFTRLSYKSARARSGRASS